ncbi:MAG TPA: hypothetical protein ENF26_03845 [Methanomicrobia archaeon]|nr:hypothetical protein [Methanomicrobia archaeon]HEX59264.1 hypothetical protein [Methanomicrobia archaeon]
MKSTTATGNEESEMDVLIKRTMLIACIIGVAVAAYLIWATYQESYSALYLRPESYSNYVKAGDNVSFVYGVQCFENRPTKYKLKIFLGSVLVKEKEFELKGGRCTRSRKQYTYLRTRHFPRK